MPLNRTRQLWHNARRAEVMDRDPGTPGPAHPSRAAKVEGDNLLIRILAILLAVLLTGCGPSYSPDTYATNAAQQANKVETGVIVGVRKVRISASGTVGAVSGAAAGGVVGSQIGEGSAGAIGAVGGSLLGGLAGVASEHLVSDTNGFEYIVRKANGDMLSVAQKDKKPLTVGQTVLVITGAQARIVPDYTVPFEPPEKTAVKPAAPKPEASASHAPAPQPPVMLPPESGMTPQPPTALGTPSAAPPPIIAPPDVPAAKP
jgi:outer membrane lipoprotein SlyB